MEPNDLQDVENSLEDCARHQDQFMRTASSFHVKADDKYTRSVECVVYMITGGRIPTIDTTPIAVGSCPFLGVPPMKVRSPAVV